MLKWAQKVVQWKKINVGKVSESFDMCRQLLLLTLHELERFALDLFIDENKEEMNIMMKEDTDSFGIDVATMYDSYLKDFSTTDDRRKYMKGFIIMASQFRMYWTATRCGDRIMM